MAFRNRLDSVGGAAALHGLSLIGASVILASARRRDLQIAGAVLVSVCNKLQEFRNPYGGDGADQMSEVIAGYRILTSIIPDREASDDLFLRAVNAQVLISYVASGVAKVISNTWRSGDALAQILNTQLYGGSVMASFFKRYPALGKAVSWGTIVWESAFPLIYVLPPAGAQYGLHAIKAFHLGIAATMGLPRFFWAFSSSHAAVLYVIANRSRTS